MSSTHYATQNFQKVSDLFFKSGNIVISTQRPGSNNVHLFKLHSKVLAMHAKALSGVLTLPPAPPHGVDVNEYFEGTPVVRLFDDPADLAEFFRAIYDPSTLVFKRSAATNAAKAYPLLVLADKYIADDMECMIEFQLRQDWPRSLGEWDAFENRTMHMYQMHQQRRGEGTWDELVPEPASYIRLARIAKVAERQRVAAAFYQLSRMSRANEWGKKGIACFFNDPTGSQLAKMRRAMWSLLSEDEMRRLQRGKERLAAHVAQRAKRVGKEVGVDHLEPCARQWAAATERLLKSDDVLGTLLRLDREGFISAVCNDCTPMLRRSVRSERYGIWDLLPECFGVYPNERARLDTCYTGEGEYVVM